MIKNITDLATKKNFPIAFHPKKTTLECFTLNCWCGGIKPVLIQEGPSVTTPPPLLIHQGCILGEFYVEILAWGFRENRYLVFSQSWPIYPAGQGQKLVSVWSIKLGKEGWGREFSCILSLRVKGPTPLILEGGGRRITRVWRQPSLNNFKCIADRPEFKVQVSRCPSSESRGESLERPESREARVLWSSFSLIHYDKYSTHQN